MHIRLSLAAFLLGIVSAANAATPPPSPASKAAASVPDHAPDYDPAAASGPLFDTVAALDASFFDAFNRCADPAQLQRHAEQLDPALEFYHDKGGASFGSAKYLADVKANVCGKFERKLVPGTLRVYPIPGFGAIALGVHVFCPFASGRCEGAGDFFAVWQQVGERWRATRVISYAHRPV